MTAAGSAVQVLARRSAGSGGVGWELKGFGQDLLWGFKSYSRLLATTSSSTILTYFQYSPTAESGVFGLGMTITKSGLEGYIGWVYTDSVNTILGAYFHYPTWVPSGSDVIYYTGTFGFQKGLQGPGGYGDVPVGTTRLAVAMFDATVNLPLLHQGYYSSMVIPVDNLI